MDKKALIITLLLVAALMVIAAVINLPAEETDTMNFNGTDYTYSDLESEFGTKDANGMTGVPLDKVILSTDFADLDSDSQNETLFCLIAEDGWQKNVSWSDMQTGILVETDQMAYFPDLPGAYKIKHLASIDDVDLGPVAIILADGNWNSATETTWSELFAEVDVVNFTDNDQALAGLNIVDVLHYAGFDDLENATFTFEGVDGYVKSVNYTEIQSGYLLEDGMKTDFVNLDGQYHIKNVIRITVE